MDDTSNENLVKKNKKNLLSSFYSITEKQEESYSNSSVKDIKICKPINTDNNSKSNFIYNNEFPKKESNENNNLLKPIRYKTKKSSRSFNKLTEKKNNEEENYIKKKKGSRVKLIDLRARMTDQNLPNIFTKQFKNNEIITIIKPQSDKDITDAQRNLSILIHSNINNINHTNYTNNNNLRLFNKTLSRSKSILSSSNESFIQFYSNKKENKNNSTIVRRKKIINFNENNNDKTLQLNLFEKLRNSPMFEKSEKILYKERFCYALLMLFSFLSIILQISDALLYNKKSTEFLRENNSTLYLNDYINYQNYHILEKRQISIQENYIRIFNIIFSLICVIITLRSYRLKNSYIVQTNKNNKNFYGKYRKFSHHKKKKSIKDEEHINIIPNGDIIPKKKLPKSELVKAIITCIINLICFPPSVNKVYITIKNDFVFVYSLNSIILIFTMLKFINIIRAIVHLSPLNKLIYKTICNSKMVKMDFLFMLRYFLNRYPITFIIINFFIFGTIFCILIYAIEFFSLDIKNGYWNNKGDNNLKNLYNTIYLYLFFIIKNEFGDIRPKSEIGLFIVIIIGTFGSLAISYFVYFMLQLIKFSVDEERAYSKLSKIFNPLNKEHKSANLIKNFILARKVFKNYKNIEKDYLTNKLKIKKTKIYKKSYKKLIFSPDKIYKNFVLLEENNKYRRKYINYLVHKFIIKTKLLSESAILNDKLKIARNFSHSFTDVLKTLGHKIRDNLNQMNSKLQVVIFKEGKYKDFMRFHAKNLKKIIKLSRYQNEIIDYLINRHNSIDREEYLELKENKRNSETVLYSGKNLHQKMKKFSYINSPRKYGYHKVKSSVISSGRLTNLGMIFHSKECLKKKNLNNHMHEDENKNKNKIQRAKSLNHYNLHYTNKVKKIINNEKLDIKDDIKRKHSFHSQTFEKISSN